MSTLWEQRMGDVQRAIRRRDNAAAAVDHREHYLSEAEAELATAHQEFVTARDALYQDFPELDRDADTTLRAPVIAGVVNHQT